MGKEFTIGFPVAGKPISPSRVLPLSRLICLRDLVEDEKLKAMIQVMIDEITGGVGYEQVVIDFQSFDFPIIPLFEEELRRRALGGQQ